MGGLYLRPEPYLARASSSGAAPAVTGDLIQAEVMNAGPITGAGNIDTNGRVIRMRFKGMSTGLAVDRTKCTITVTHPGWNTSKVYSATNVTETMSVREKVRQPSPNQTLRLDATAGSDVDVYFFLDRPIPRAPSAVTQIVLGAGFYGTSNAITFTGITNSSTREYKYPQFGWHQQRYWARMTNSGLDVECTVDHDGARNFQTVAVVEPYVHIGATEYGSVAISSMTQSTKLSGRPFQLSVYAGTVPLGGAPQGEAYLDARIYPWIGDAVWDTATFGATIPTNSNCPAGLPINVDTDGSYTDVGAYVSATGVTIGTPSIKPLGSLGSYATEGAYATAAAVAAAVRTYNNSGSRARAHDDIAGGWALAPNGVAIAGLGGNLSTVATYPNGLGHFHLGREAGSTKSTTGWTYAATSTNKTLPRRARIYDCAIMPGAFGTADHTVFLQNSGIANVTTQPTLANAVDWVVEACVGTGANESTNAVFLNKGFIDYWNNDFTDFAGSPYQQVTGFYAGVRSIAGCDLNNSSSSSPSTIDCTYIVATRIRQIRPEVTNPASVNKPFAKGGMFWNVDVRVEAGTTGSSVSIGQLSTGNAIDARGFSILGLSTSRTRSGFSTLSDTSPALQITADYNSGAGTDMPGIENINIAYVSVAGGRLNWFYNEAFGTAVYKERDSCVLSVAAHQKNNKSDVSVAAGGASGNRMGPLPFRYGQNVAGVVTGDNSASVTAIGIGNDCWLGEVLPLGSTDNVGYSNMYTTDTSLVGTNVYANPMDWAPKAALKNAVPAGRAKVPYDRLGTARRDDGTDAAGCLSY